MIVESYEDVIVLSGALRSNFWETIHTAISLLLKRHPTGVVIDCSGITECTPEGADTFIDVMEFIENHDARVIVAAVPDNVLEVLRAVPGVRSQLPIAKTVDQARQSLDLLAQEPQRKRKVAPATAGKVVLFVTGGDSDRTGAQAAVRIAEIMQSTVVMVFIVLVPRELPEQAPLPEKEAAAVKAFASLDAFFEQNGIATTRILKRGRDVGTALDEIMEEQGAHTLLMALGTSMDGLEGDMKLMRAVLQKVEQSVMIVRAPR